MMMYKERIRQLCQQQTELNDVDVEILISKATDLLENKNFQSNDVFIDVKNIYSDNAVVIFHKKPSEESSLYKQEVVGETAFFEKEPGVIRTLLTGLPSIGLLAITQEGLTIHQSVYPIYRGDRVIGTLIIESRSPTYLLPVSSLQSGSYQTANIEAVDPCFSFMDYMDDAVLLFDEKGYLIYCNPASEELYKNALGYKNSILNLHYNNLCLDSATFDELDFLQLGQITKNDQISYGSFCFSLKKQILPSGQLMVVYKDITDECRKEKALQIEMDAVREANHRVKNNLQTIISLLRLQIDQSEKNEVKDSLQETINRISSISVVHEMLMKDRGGKLSIDELVTQIVQNVRVCFSGKLSIKFNYQVQPRIFIEKDKAIAVALTINELLQNSYEHAFKLKKYQKNAKINLQITCICDIITIQVSDNGSGYKMDEIKADHIGLVLVDSFVKSKLCGRIKVRSSSKGTITRISFKK